MSQGNLGTRVTKSQSTYYFASDKQFTAGEQVNIDVDLFNIETKNFTIPEGENAGEVVSLKFLAGLK